MPLTTGPNGATDRGLLLVVALSLALNTIGLGWGLPPREYFAWDVDGIAPLQPLVAAKRMFVDAWWNSGYYNKYPLGHFFVLMAAYAPYLGYLWLSGGLRNPTEVYPFGFTDPETALTVLSLIGRGISALMGVGIVALVYLTARRLAGRGAAVCSGLVLAFSPAFIFYAHTGNVDVPSLFWAALGLFAFGRLVAGECAPRNYVLLGAAVGMAVATKEQTAGLFLLVPLSVAILHAQHRYPAPRPPSALLRAAVDRPVLGGLAAALATFVVATHLIFNWEGNLLRLRWRIHRVHPTLDDYPRSFEFDGPLEGLAQLASYTWEVMNPVLFLAALAGVLVLPLRHRWARHFAVPLVSYVVLTVGMLDYFRARFVMEVALVLALFAGPVLAALWTAAARRSAVLVVAVGLLWAYSFVYGAEVDVLLVRDARYAAETWLRDQTPPGARVEVYASEHALPRLPHHLDVVRQEITPEALAGLATRAPALLVFSSAYHLEPGTPEARLVGRLFDGEFGYRPLRVFRRDPVVGPRIVRGLSPEIVVLAPRADGPRIQPAGGR